MPRIDADSTERSPENGAPASRLTPGVRLPRDFMSVRLRSCIVSALNALTVIGTLWMFSSRRSAVTTTSSRAPPVASAPAGALDACCAWAVKAAPSAVIQAVATMGSFSHALRRVTRRFDCAPIPRINLMLFPLDHCVVDGRQLSRLEQVHPQLYASDRPLPCAPECTTRSAAAEPSHATRPFAFTAYDFR